MPRFSRGFDLDVAGRALARTDRDLGRWMRKTGSLDVAKGWRKPFDPVDALARAILYQQLSGKAASTIVGRVESAIGDARLHCDTLSRVDDAVLRACGVSGNKTLALRDLMRREADGEIPSVRQMAHMENEAIIEALVPIRGIGRWTVEMMLMFRLGRADVLPIDDLGVRKGIQVLRGLPVMPKPREAAALGEPWAPWRSLAAFHLWRIADTASAEAAPVKRSQD